MCIYIYIHLYTYMYVCSWRSVLSFMARSAGGRSEPPVLVRKRYQEYPTPEQVVGTILVGKSSISSDYRITKWKITMVTQRLTSGMILQVVGWYRDLRSSLKIGYHQFQWMILVWPFGGLQKSEVAHVQTSHHHPVSVKDNVRHIRVLYRGFSWKGAKGKGLDIFSIRGAVGLMKRYV